MRLGIGGTELARHRGNSVLLALGPIRPGHLLVVPPVHKLSTSVLKAEQRAHILSTVKMVGEVFVGRGLNFVWFEHGSARAKNRISCVDHAHIHLVPIESSIRTCVENFFSVEQVVASDFLSATPSDESYLLFQDTDGTQWATNSIEVPSQFMRQILWSRRKFRAHWDWRSELGGDSMNFTRAALADALRQGALEL